MSIESEQAVKFAREMRSFRIAVDKVRLTPGLKLELATFAQDTVSGFKRRYSHLYPLENETILNERLTSFIKELVPEGEDRKSLEAGFEEDPDKIKHKSHHDVVTSEWQTIHDNVVIGIRAIRDQRSESVRTWYLRNTAKKRG